MKNEDVDLKQKLDVTRQLHRISALRYNTHFEEEVKKIRRRYAIPGDTSGAQSWLLY
ncbi:hypothetical protein ACFLW6_04585 [Chloroflexota bacterium]